LGLVPFAFLERTLDYRRIAAIELVSLFASLVVAGPLAMAGYGSWSLVYGLIAQVGTYDAVAFVAARYVPRLVWDQGVSRDMLCYAFGMALGQWASQLRTLVAPLIAGHFLGAAAVGQIAMAIRFAEGFSFMGAITFRLAMPILARVQSQPAKLVAAISEGLQLQMLAVAPVLLAFVWNAGWLVPMIFGKRWLPSLNIYPFIALSRLTTGLFGMHLAVLYVLGRNLDAAVYVVINTMLFISGALILIPLIGPGGVWLGRTGRIRQFRRHTPIHLQRCGTSILWGVRGMVDRSGDRTVLAATRIMGDRNAVPCFIVAGLAEAVESDRQRGPRCKLSFEINSVLSRS
jgi:PST family polysaccharide transporter